MDLINYVFFNKYLMSVVTEKTSRSIEPPHQVDFIIQNRDSWDRTLNRDLIERYESLIDQQSRELSNYSGYGLWIKKLVGREFEADKDEAWDVIKETFPRPVEKKYQTRDAVLIDGKLLLVKKEIHHNGRRYSIWEPLFERPALPNLKERAALNQVTGLLTKPPQVQDGEIEIDHTCFVDLSADDFNGIIDEAMEEASDILREPVFNVNAFWDLRLEERRKKSGRKVYVFVPQNKELGIGFQEKKILTSIFTKQFIDRSLPVRSKDQIPCWDLKLIEKYFFGEKREIFESLKSILPNPVELSGSSFIKYHDGVPLFKVSKYRDLRGNEFWQAEPKYHEVIAKDTNLKLKWPLKPTPSNAIICSGPHSLRFWEDGPNYNHKKLVNNWKAIRDKVKFLGHPQEMERGCVVIKLSAFKQSEIRVYAGEFKGEAVWYVMPKAYEYFGREVGLRPDRELLSIYKAMAEPDNVSHSKPQESIPSSSEILDDLSYSNGDYARSNLRSVLSRNTTKDELVENSPRIFDEDEDLDDD